MAWQNGGQRNECCILRGSTVGPRATGHGAVRGNPIARVAPSSATMPRSRSRSKSRTRRTSPRGRKRSRSYSSYSSSSRSPSSSYSRSESSSYDSRSYSRSPTPRGRRVRRSPFRGRSRSPRRRRVSPVRSRKRSRTPSPKRVVVRGLTRNVNVDHVKEIFGTFADIVQVDLPLNPKTKTNMGRAEITFKTSSGADKARSHMDGGQVDGQVIHVSIVPPERRGGDLRRPSSPRRFGGGRRSRSPFRRDEFRGRRRSPFRRPGSPPRRRSRSPVRRPMSRSPVRRH
ncbi:hypothetical protein PBRA_002806 [Plasmodiophora brassicae]|uniref:RRM domain-containing protein n=1 Tax=Plasmodiophora brassicae TaxID=37360 RepID=A0A0G4J645_PLABS|nr:hypothetical protein PBRA_002806 [Plasmodiophora brassicae]